MILQAAAYGAAAVLLICALLDDKQLREYREMAEDLGMDALVEAHDAEEVARALKSGARIIGVNNRDLRTFEVDMANSINAGSSIVDCLSKRNFSSYRAWSLTFQYQYLIAASI